MSDYARDFLRDHGATETLEQMTRRAVIEALEKCGGSKAKAAKMLGKSRSWIYEYLDRNPINRPLEQARKLGDRS